MTILLFSFFDLDGFYLSWLTAIARTFRIMLNKSGKKGLQLRKKNTHKTDMSTEIETVV